MINTTCAKCLKLCKLDDKVLLKKCNKYKVEDKKPVDSRLKSHKDSSIKLELKRRT